MTISELFQEAHKEAEEGENRDVEENQEPVNEENKDLAKYKEVQKGLETLAVEFSEALEKAKLKEREMLEKIRLEAVEKGKLEQNEQELQTLKNKLVDAQKQITKEKEVTEEEKKKGMTALEKSSEEIKKLEGSIRAQKNRIDELEQINGKISFRHCGLLIIRGSQGYDQKFRSRKRSQYQGRNRT